MGLFDKWKKKPQQEKTEDINEIAGNAPGLLLAKLLFPTRPVIDVPQILAELRSTFPDVEGSSTGDVHLFVFPSLQVQLTDAAVPARCSLIVHENADGHGLPEEAFQQNWHWKEARAVVEGSRYTVVVNDMMSTTLDYKQRYSLFAHFLIAVVKQTQPSAINSVTGMHLLEPARITKLYDVDNIHYLDAVLNVRLFNTGDNGELIMDTLGLHALGLPDLQIRFTNIDPGAIAAVLWNTAYYIYEKGDVIVDGHTVPGVAPQSKWPCAHELSLTPPERIVIHIFPG